MTNEQAVVDTGMVVAMHYSLYRTEGDLIESTEGRDPVLFLFGDRQVLAALQDELKGKSAGDKFEVEISHDKAYGRHYPEKIERLPTKRIDGGKQQSFRVGQIIQMDMGKGRRQSATVVKVGKFNVDVDTNHPLAGQNIRFEVTISDVRVATETELSHGHAHGPGGHQH